MKRPKINEKEAGVGPFFLKRRLFLNFELHHLQKTTKVSDFQLF